MVYHILVEVITQPIRLLLELIPLKFVETEPISREWSLNITISFTR